MATIRGFLKSRVRHLFSAVLVLLGVVTIIPAFNGSAAAHHAEASASVNCEGVISYSASAWAGYADNPDTPEDEYDLSRTNSSVRVWIEVLGSGTPIAEQFGSFSAPGFSFSGTFQWPTGFTGTIRLQAQALATWGNGGTAGPYAWPVDLTLPTDCEGNPDVSINPFCDNATDHSGDGTVVVTFTNEGGPFAETVTFNVGAFGTEGAKTVTVAVGATETLTYTGLDDGEHTIVIFLGDEDFSKTFTIDCDKAAPDTDAVASCNLESNGQILLTLFNNGGESVTFTVDGPGDPFDVTVDAGGVPATHTYLDLPDGDYLITITASDGTTGLDQTVTVDCDHADPSASAKAECTENFDGVITLTLVNAGNEGVIFTITDPRDSTTTDVPVGAGAQVDHPMGGTFADGDVVIPIVANGKDLTLTVAVDCDPLFDLMAVCTDVTAEDVYWYAIKNTETTDIVVTWDGGTLEVLAGQTVNIASTVNPLSLKFNGVEIANATANTEICKQNTIVEKKLNGQPPTGETYTIRISRLDGSTFFEDLTFDLEAGDIVPIDLPSTLGDDGIDYLIEEIGKGTSSKSIINVNGTGGSIITASGHLNETISVVVVNGYAAVQIDKQVITDPVLAGGKVTYTLQATNTGGLTLEDVKITDLLPEDTSFDSAVVQGNGGTCSLTVATRPQRVECLMDDALPVGGVTNLITLVVNLDADVADGTEVINQSMVQGDFSDAALDASGLGRAVHSRVPALVELTCPGNQGEVCDLDAKTVTVKHNCDDGTTTSSVDCGGTTTTTTIVGTTTTVKGGTTTTVRSTTTVSGTSPEGGTLPRSGGGTESKPILSMAFGMGCIGSALLLSRPRLPRRWRSAFN